MMTLATTIAAVKTGYRRSRDRATFDKLCVQIHDNEHIIEDLQHNITALQEQNEQLRIELQRYLDAHDLTDVHLQPGSIYRSADWHSL